MERRTSVLKKSIWPAVGGIVAAAGIGGFGFFLFMGGWQNGEIALTIVGGLFLLGGVFMFPMSIWSAFNDKRGGYGDCPVCGTAMVADKGDARNLLCHGCATYIDAQTDHLTTITGDRTHHTPYWAAPTPWPDIHVTMSKMVAFSAFDFAQDKLIELMMKKAGNKELGAHWPAGCCVCGKPATRTDTLVMPVTVGGQFRDSKATLIARDIPYCAEHKDGIAFDNVLSFNSRGDHHSFGIKFRSLAYRDKFRELNPWNWAGLPPLKTAKPPAPAGSSPGLAIAPAVTAAPSPSAPAAGRAAPTLWPSLGVLFDIDELGASDDERVFYGYQARLIFMRHFKPRRFGRAYLWHGDTQSTLDGARERRFCIAVTTPWPAGIEMVRAAFAKAADKGLAPPALRFVEHPVDIDFASGAPKPIRREPLPLWLSIDDNHTAVLPAAEREDIDLCERFSWRYRVGS